MVDIPVVTPLQKTYFSLLQLSIAHKFLKSGGAFCPLLLHSWVLFVSCTLLWSARSYVHMHSCLENAVSLKLFIDVILTLFPSVNNGHPGLHERESQGCFIHISLMDSNVKYYFAISLVTCSLYFENSVHFIGLFPDMNFYFFNIYFSDFS